jgi:hypothetical protein
MQAVFAFTCEQPAAHIECEIAAIIHEYMRLIVVIFRSDCKVAAVAWKAAQTHLHGATPDIADIIAS